MEYNLFCGEKVSRLGFGTMRFPMLAEHEIDVEQTKEMFKLAIEGGINYFDTAYPYLDGKSELVTTEALKDYPRESYFLADKYPGHQPAASYIPSEIFEEQLKKCQTEYFDFYLLHNVCEFSLATYIDPKWGIVDYFVEQKKLGRIKHLGFSCHGRVDMLREFLDKYGDAMEFCQIQLNYVDWTLQDAAAKYALLEEREIPVIVMEPIRGGKLAKLSDEAEGEMRKMRPNDSTAAWSFRWIKELENVKVVLSGMSNIEQMKDNIKTFSDDEKLTVDQSYFLIREAEKLKNAVPCTACGYCKAGCPKELDIPTLVNLYNDATLVKSLIVNMFWEQLPEEKKSSACIACGKCAKICPQKIDIPDVMKKLTELAPELPNWIKICKEREEAAKALKNKGET